MAIKLATAPKTKTTRLRMSYEEFLQWAGEDTHAEWVDGEVIIHTPPKDIHQATVRFLHRLLGLFVDLFNLGKIRIAPFEIKLEPGGPSREPDLLFIAKENLERLTERLTGPADLIVEVISEDSVRRDRDDKFREYGAAGVREYWIIDPRPGKQRADFFRLEEGGAYRLFATEDDARAESQVLPGFWLRPAWLWEADEGDPFLSFCEMAGLPQDESSGRNRTGTTPAPHRSLAGGVCRRRRMDRSGYIGCPKTSALRLQRLARVASGT
jgi:Uma2 family endonuclease